ncbi:hypothetical protein D3C73_1349300 [compost metagenome]
MHHLVRLRAVRSPGVDAHSVLPPAECSHSSEVALLPRLAVLPSISDCDIHVVHCATDAGAGYLGKKDLAPDPRRPSLFESAQVEQGLEEPILRENERAVHYEPLDQRIPLPSDLSRQ